MTTSLTFSRQIPVRAEVAVFVAGGGPAGTAAAIAAARAGASVFLAENEICFGGMGTAGGLPMICCFSDEVNFLAGGVGREIHDRMVERGGALAHPLKKASDLYIQPETLKLVYDELVTAENRVTPSLATRIIGVECADGVVSHVICQGKSGIFAVRCAAVVDATGDGDISAWAGAPFKKGDHRGRMQPGTLVSMWAGIDWPKAEAAGHGLWHQSGGIAQAIAAGVFSQPDPGMPGIMPTGRTTGNGNAGHIFGVDGTDERSLTQAAIFGRRQIQEYGRYFREYLTGYEGIELCGSAARLGIRETRRITGDYELTFKDYLAQAVFADEIGRYCYPVDVHACTLAHATGTAPPEPEAEKFDFHNMRLKPGESYGIPYRILTPRKLKNVLTAGRCVSGERAVLGSLRVMAGCFITGQAAGVAAAMAASAGTDVHALPVRDLQRQLNALGAYLPNLPGAILVPRPARTASPAPA
ncbi:MAG: FAD-dependent oxidoreductase [Lentisphaeria bacterium]|jgi:ribulose 1,5-bisphosphate synthetase/thiazole synthase